MSYFEKSKKGISNTFNSSAAQQELKRKQELDNAVSSYQPTDTSYYDDMLSKNMAAIMTGKSNYNFAPDEVLSQYARDYSALNKLGVAEGKQLTNQYAQGYAADYTNAVADQVSNDYITSPELLSLAQNINNSETLNKLNGMKDALSLKDFEQQKDDDYIKALLQARGLSQSVYNKFAEQDLQAYTDNQNALQSMLKYEGNLELDKQKLAQEQREADQSYELSKLAYQKAKSSGSGGSGRSSGGSLKGSGGYVNNASKGLQAIGTSGDGAVIIDGWAKQHKGYTNEQLQSALAELYKKGYITQRSMDTLYLKYQNQIPSKATKTGWAATPTKKNNRFADTRNGIRRAY